MAQSQISPRAVFADNAADHNAKLEDASGAARTRSHSGRCPMLINAFCEYERNAMKTATKRAFSFS
jgi:hypothetical protein